MIQPVAESRYKDQSSFVLESDVVRAEFVAQGARMVSLQDKRVSREFLVQQDSDAYVRARYGEAMTAEQAAGYDDMFPTIDACHYEDFPWEGVHLPDHGEVWSLDWKMMVEDTVLNASVHGVRLPYRLSRSITLRAENQLRMDYTLENYSPFDLPYLWSAHPLLQAQEGARIEVPEECGKAINRLSVSGRLGAYGDEFKWPTWTDSLGNNHDLSVIRSPQTGDLEKYFFKNRLSGGWCRILYPAEEASLTLSFPSERVPYLAVVVDEGGSGPRYYLLLEPCSAPFDRLDISRMHTGESKVPSGGTCKWFLDWTLDA